jgi:hypothetical protein
MSATMSYPALAQILFTCRLQPTDRPAPSEIRAAVDERLSSHDGTPAACAARVAQEAGDHPELYAARMRWALRAVRDAYATELLAA